MNYEEQDTYGMYKTRTSADPFAYSADGLTGPEPELMGANTLVGNDVYNHKNEVLGKVR